MRAHPAPEKVDLLLDHAQLVTVAGGSGPLSGPRQSAIGLIPDGALAIRGEHIAAIGPRAEVLSACAPETYLDLGGRAVLPGLVDAHTHLVWAGSRVDEFERRLRGATYLEIMAAGGGISSTVRATRNASTTDLLDGALKRLDQLLWAGTTTCEAKTGYGLSLAEELRQLDVLAEADRRHPVHVIPTFLGAHAVPDEFHDRPEAYVEELCATVLPEVAVRYPGIFCDVFCDQGAFDLRQTERLLRRALSLGMRAKVHADEFACLGCAALAAELGATSADHLVATTPDQMRALARAKVIAVLLPGTTFGLASHPYANGRAFVDHGVPVALGTDFNPGTCPCLSMPFVIALACRYLGLTPAEAVVAATRNAAYACGVGERAGRLEVGWPADLVVLDAADYRELAYWFATDLVAGVMIGGVWRRVLSEHVREQRDHHRQGDEQPNDDH